MTAVCKTIGVARSNVALRAAGRPPRRRGRPPLPDEALVTDIEAVIADMPSYGYARVWAVLRRQGRAARHPPVNRKRVYRVMRVHGLLLHRHAGGREERRHDGKIAVDRSNLRWCSDGFEIACDNAEKVRVAFALDCCDREAMGHVATTEGIKGEDVRDLMIVAVEQRFGQVNRLPKPIEWLSDNGSCYIATETRKFAGEIGFLTVTTPVKSPQSNGMAESFVRTFKRDYVEVNPKPDAATVIRSLPKWFEHYNELHPHRALGYWNANGAGLTNFAIECFIDEIARQLGKDPLAIRLELLSDTRGRRTIEEVAAMARWNEPRSGRASDHALGLAYSDGGEWNCRCAQVAEVSVDRASGAIKVHKIFAAVDPGIVVQPGHLRQQIETSILFGLGTALRERITLKKGEVQEANFYEYELTRSTDMPEIEIKIVDTGFRGISGAGQPGVPPVAPAIANAVAALTGVRLRRLPMLPERVKAAMPR